MGEKKAQNVACGEKNKDKKNSGGKEEAQSVVLKMDMHCAGCVSKIVKCVKSIEGVLTAKPELEASKLTVIGNVDPLKLREILEHKTKKRVELISPQSKKEKENKGENNSKNESNKKKSEEKSEKKTEEKKSKEPPVTSAVLKVALHCQGCVDKIHRTVSRNKGVLEMSLDKQKDLIMVKGTMDAKALAQALQDRLKRTVEIVQPKKEKDNGADEKKGENGGSGGGGNDTGKKGKGKKGGGGGGDGGADNSCGGGKMEESRMEYMGVPGAGAVVPGYGYPYPYPYAYPSAYPYSYPYPSPYGYAGYPVQLHAPQMFSDENPNACSIM